MEEQELMQRVQEGDEMAFTEIVRRYKDRIVNYLWHLTRDYQTAVELSQETFIKVYFKANRYKPVAPVSSWIYTIASNLAKSELKRAGKATVVPLDSVSYRYSQPDSASNNPESSALVKTLRKALEALPSRYKIPVILKDIEGFSQEEIAQILGKPLGTIKARISRGREYLKKAMENGSLSIHFREE